MPGSVTLRCSFCQTMNRVDLALAKSRPACGSCHRPILLDRPVKVNPEDFARTVLEAEGPVLVDVYADWCGPCRVMAPALDDVARETTGEVLVVKLDADRAPEIVGRFGIRGIPTLLLLQGGQEKGRLVGAAGRAEILRLLEPVRAAAQRAASGSSRLRSA